MVAFAADIAPVLVPEAWRKRWFGEVAANLLSGAWPVAWGRW